VCSPCCTGSEGEFAHHVTISLIWLRRPKGKISADAIAVGTALRSHNGCIFQHGRYQGNRVVLKRGDGEVARALVENEFKCMSPLQHENIVRIFGRVELQPGVQSTVFEGGDSVRNSLLGAHV